MSPSNRLLTITKAKNCFLLFSLVIISGFPNEITAEKLVNGTCPSALKSECKDGIVFKRWGSPEVPLSGGDRAAHATVYFASLLYMFLGVSIIADRFMAAIEVITSQEKEVVIKKKTGEKQTVSVRIWNETVSNLTLMALGSSAPEILLSIIEIIGNNFNAGDLGPGTIVGSAAFNLFIIIGYCCIVIPDGEVRRIKHLSVFFVTATFSVFAYLWLYLIIAVTSKGKVVVWEAVITFMFFPLTVILAYIADTKIFFKRFLKRKYIAGGVKTYEGDLEMQNNHVEDVAFQGRDNDEMTEYERHRMDYIEVIRDIRKKNPNIDTKSLEEMAQIEVLNRGPKSRAFYRMQATRQMTGSGNVIKKSKVERKLSTCIVEEVNEDEDVQHVFFDPDHYTVMEDVGTMYVTVSRAGGNIDARVSVDYSTEDGTANAGDDYEKADGTLIFEPGEKHKQFPVTIIDDEIFEEDEHFFVRLSNLKLISGEQEDLRLDDPPTATIMVLDDDHAGIFHFEAKETKVSESCGEAEVKVIRSSGARGCVRIPYQTISGTAHGNGKDYEDAEGWLEFDNNQSEGFIKVRIVDDNEYEKNESFYLQIGDPVLIRKAGDDEYYEKHHHHRPSIFGKCNDSTHKGNFPDKPSEEKEFETVEDMGKPRLGEITRLEIHIIESMEFKNTIDHLLSKGKWSLVVGTSSWKEQFIEAITVSAGDGEDGEDDEDAEEKLPSCMDYVMHFLTIFWKVLFAFVPPTDYGGGWYCFIVSITVIGLLTAVIGDLASGFGCSVGLTDAVTATTFVALGTSLPDTFASKVAAINDDSADSSIGNVTGSNAVNVFLGIGIAWSIAAVYHAVNNTTFVVEPGSLGFSVTIFCILAVVAIFILFIRRRPAFGGELGGPKVYKIITGCTLVSFWVLYILLQALENYCHIEGF